MKQKSRKLLASIHRNFVDVSETITCCHHLRFAGTRERNQAQSSWLRKPFPLSIRFHFLYSYKKFVFGHTRSSLNSLLGMFGGTVNNEKHEYHSSPGGVIFAERAEKKFLPRRKNFRSKVSLKSMLIKRYFLEIPISFETLVESSRVH